MSSSTTDAGEGRDGGFTLIEIVVALGILMAVSAALLPQLIVGIRSTETARLVSQAKGVAQGEIEHMRNLPWHVAPDTSSAEHEYYDVFDNYYPNVDPPVTIPACGASDDYEPPDVAWSGYVAEDDDRRCDYEPEGAMYRTVVERTSPGFMVVINTQFLAISSGATVLEPAPTYDTNGANNLPMSSRIGVTVTVLYSDGQTKRPVSTYTELADEQVAETRVEIAADGTAVDIVTGSPLDGAVSLSAGVLHLRGALANTSTVAATVASVAAGKATGDQAVGAVGSVSVPAAPDTTNSVTTPAPAGGLPTTCDWACWSDSAVVIPPGVSAADGRPIAGSSSSPVQALLTGAPGFEFFADGTTGYRTDLDLGGPVVEVSSEAAAGPSGISLECAGPPSAGNDSLISAAGYLHTSPAEPAASAGAEACVVTRASTVSLFPTSFAPYGVVQIELGSSYARCQVGGSTHGATPSYGFEAVVRVHAPEKEPESGHSPDAYVTVALISSAEASTDPLDAIDMDRPVGGQHVLGDYVGSWSSPTTAEIETDHTGGSRVRVPGALTLSSTPVRIGAGTWNTTDPSTGDPINVTDVDLSSTVTATFGAVSCTAQDSR